MGGADSDGPTSLLLVEDDPMMLDELRRLVDAQDDFDVTGAFTNGGDALAFAGPAQMAIVDLGLPDTTGADLIRELLRSRTLDVMAHTVFDDRSTVFEAIVAGASSYVLKGTAGDEIVAALRELRAGGSPMSPRIARAVVAAFQKQGSVADRYTLTPRERGVLERLEEGFSYKEVAAQLHLSPHTVHTHIKRIYEKLHASSRAEALTKARLRGLI